MGPALLLIQAEKLGVNEATLWYFGAVVSGAIGGDGYVSAARKEVGLTSGEREIALLWIAVLAANGIEAEVRRPGRGLTWSRPAAMPSSWPVSTSATGLLCLRGMKELSTTSWLKP